MSVSKKELISSLKKYRLLKEVANDLNISQQWCIKLLKKYELRDKYNFKKNIGSNPYFKGKKLSTETKNKISETKKNSIIIPYNKLPIVNVECSVCGNIYEISKGAKNRSKNKKYCSNDCKNKAHSNKMKNKRINGMDVTCVNCGKIFYKPMSLIKDNNFCSYDCVHNFKRGKTYDDLYGVEKSNQIKEKIMIQTLENNKNMPMISKPHIMLKNKMLESNITGFKTSQRLGYYEIDELDINRKICVEVDGDYWHSTKRAIVNDKRKNTYVKNKGFKMIRIKECEIYEDINKCIDIIQEGIND